ncbi:hypothetical protein QTN47_03205 [Danxiaibacter flavus]|uniref:DUF1801 domain-containing protein n=1 Tax=Danxiaibacter flavus TaxID=3049108 RepID=A0ABV3Z9F5_9BACT|nr:hypothetical protein QNM32_03205 [Chitinophagaceae bacterium DXS]
MAKATASSKKETKPIKYADKSEGQPELVPVFNKLVELLSPYEKGSIIKVGGKEGQISLISKKEIEVAGRKRPEQYFASALVQKGYVGFYFMPVYSDTDIKEVFKPELLKLLKGKSCFHIKKADEEIYKQIKDALKMGYKIYKDRKWID